MFLLKPLRGHAEMRPVHTTVMYLLHSQFKSASNDSVNQRKTYRA
jgi:hypothetical protein